MKKGCIIYVVLTILFMALAFLFPEKDFLQNIHDFSLSDGSPTLLYLLLAVGVIFNLVNLYVCQKEDNLKSLIWIGYVSVIAASVIELLYFAGVKGGMDLFFKYFPYPVRSGWTVYSVASFAYSFLISVQAFSGFAIQKFMKKEMEGCEFARILLIVIGILGLLVPGIILVQMFMGGIVPAIIAFLGVAIAYSLIAKPIPVTYYSSSSKSSAEEESPKEIHWDTQGGYHPEYIREKNEGKRYKVHSQLAKYSLPPHLGNRLLNYIDECFEKEVSKRFLWNYVDPYIDEAPLAPFEKECLKLIIHDHARITNDDLKEYYDNPSSYQWGDLHTKWCKKGRRKQNVDEEEKLEDEMQLRKFSDKTSTKSGEVRNTSTDKDVRNMDDEEEVESMDEVRRKKRYEEAECQNKRLRDNDRRLAEINARLSELSCQISDNERYIRNESKKDMPSYSYIDNCKYIIREAEREIERLEAEKRDIPNY